MNNKHIFLIAIIFFVNISTLISQKYSWSTRANTKAKQLVNNFYSVLNNYCDMEYGNKKREARLMSLLLNAKKHNKCIILDFAKRGFLAKIFFNSRFCSFCYVCASPSQSPICGRYVSAMQK